MGIIDLSIPLAFGDILGSLINSIIDGQAQAARATVEFIREVGTIEGDTELDGAHKLRNIQFNYRKLDENSEPKEFTLEVPLLAMVEIPLINVKSAKLSFQYDILTTKEIKEDTTVSSSGSSGAAPAKKWFLPFKKPAVIKGRVKKSPNTKTTEEGGLTVEVELEKAALPVGLDRIIDMLELAATDNPVQPADDPNDDDT